MKTLGSTRQVDPLGRIVLPKSMRKELNMRENDTVDIVLQGNSIVITKSLCACSLCGATENLIPVAQGYICPACREQIVKEA